MASVRWTPSQVMCLLGSLQTLVLRAPHNERKSKLRSPFPHPQHALKGSENPNWLGFFRTVKYAFQKSAYAIMLSGYCFCCSANLAWRSSLWVCVTVFAVSAHPRLSWSLTGDNEMSKGRHPVGGRLWTTMYFAPLSNNACHITQARLVPLFLSKPPSTQIQVWYMPKFLCHEWIQILSFPDKSLFEPSSYVARSLWLNLEESLKGKRWSTIPECLISSIIP